MHHIGSTIHVHIVELLVILVVAGALAYANARLAPAGIVRIVINVAIVLITLAIVLWSLGAIGDPGVTVGA